MIDWKTKGFSKLPKLLVAPRGGLLMYRAWGATSGEWGGGYFSIEKPHSVLDAELRFNIAEWGNGVRFVSTFKLRQGFSGFLGPVEHGKGDMSRPGTQIYLESPFVAKVIKVGAFECLRSDVFVSGRAGSA